MEALCESCGLEFISDGGAVRCRWCQALLDSFYAEGRRTREIRQRMLFAPGVSDAQG